MPSNLSILFAMVSHTTHLSHTLHPLHYGDYSPDLGAVLEAPTTILAATALTICFIKVGSENGFDPATGATGGGILSPPCMSDTSGIDIYLTDLPIFEYTDVVGI